MATVDPGADRVPLLGAAKLGSPRAATGARRRRKLVGRVGPWQLVRTLGEGAMTRVYLARPADQEDARADYAVKVLRKEWWSEPRAIETQRREAWVGGRVSHPHVAPVLASGVSAPPFYVVTPRLEGRTAADLVASDERPPLPTALWIARQVAQALAALYDTVGMVHGDVKPSNLMVGHDGHTTLLDLGFCQTLDEARSWAERRIVGTLAYLAPERATSTTAIDPRSDLYSLGCTLYELLTGRPPHRGDSPAALLAAHREARPECVRDAAPGTPKPVASLVHRLLAKNPLRRPSSAGEVARELIDLEIACFGMR